MLKSYRVGGGWVAWSILVKGVKGLELFSKGSKGFGKMA